MELAAPRLELTPIASTFTSNIVHHGHDGLSHRIQQENDASSLFPDRSGNFGFKQPLETSLGESNGDQAPTRVEP